MALTRNQEAGVALSLVSGIGPVKGLALLTEFNKSVNIFSDGFINPNGISGINENILKNIHEIEKTDIYKRELEVIDKEKISVIDYFDDRYPEELKNVYDPPFVLFCKGNVDLLKTVSIAVVGLRKCSLYGLKTAEKLSYDLADAGITVVSGMAKGIDLASHRGSLTSGGNTIAVMGSGFSRIYPDEARATYQKMINSSNGLVISEYTYFTNPLKSNFPRRNRIISGLSCGVLVVEATRKSGAMITVDYALNEGKEVFAVPGRIDCITSSGTNFLLQTGAKLVINANDILDEINKPFSKDICNEEKKSRREIALTSQEESIVSVLSEKDFLHINDIALFSSMDIGNLSKILLRLELAKYITSMPGKYYCLTSVSKKKTVC